MTVMVVVTVASLVVVTGVATMVVVIMIMVMSVATNVLLFDLEPLLGAHQASSQVHQEESLILIRSFCNNIYSFLLLRISVIT